MSNSSKSSTPAILSVTRQLFVDKEDKTQEALSAFTEIKSCIYTVKDLGDSTNEFMECDCAEELKKGPDDQVINQSCGDNSDCINRLTLIECVDELCESTCGNDCQNQRFQKREYAKINIFQTEHKGYGVRAQENLEADDFIYEYIGEVIDEEEFRDRMVQYDIKKFKHFYFMMLQNGQFIDATLKGALARFCNHSCSPNAYVNKWVVNGKLKMGIFAKRNITMGEEITFDYNVDRYGASAQKCYCGEPNCIGFLGGKTQTDAASLLPQNYADALGVRASVEKKWIKAKKASGEKIIKDEEGDNINTEFVESLDIEACETIRDVTKVMSVLLQCENRLIASKLFERLWLTYQLEDENEEDIKDKSMLLHQVVKLHGYKCFKNVIQLFMDDQDIIQDILIFLDQLPRTTKNGITSSQINETIKKVTEEYPDLKDDSDSLLNKWDAYETYTRITKKDINAMSSTKTLNKLNDLRRIRLQPGWEIIQENGRPIYYNAEQNRKLVDPPVGTDNNNSQNTSRPNIGEPRDQMDKKFAKGPRLSEEEYQKKKRRIMEEEEAVIKRAKVEETEMLKEKFRLESEKRNVLDQIISQANKQKELEREASLKLQKDKEATRLQKRTLTQSNHQEHKWNKFFASFVPNLVKKYECDVTLSHNNIKECAKDIVKILTIKELKKGNDNMPPKDLDKHKNAKVKSFVNVYLEKFVQKYKHKDKQQYKH